MEKEEGEGGQGKMRPSQMIENFRMGTFEDQKAFMGIGYRS